MMTAIITYLGACLFKVPLSLGAIDDRLRPIPLLLLSDIKLPSVLIVADSLSKDPVLPRRVNAFLCEAGILERWLSPCANDLISPWTLARRLPVV